ncbi:MAG: HAD family hydrolase [Cyclobacteriaceae bacterium]
MISKLNELDLSLIKLVVFDVDGTLYNQKQLRTTMLLKLLSYYLIRPLRWKELEIISTFRKEREKLAFNETSNLQEMQFQVCADKLKIDVARVKSVINHWIFSQPLPLLKQYVYPEIYPFLQKLKEAGIPVAVWSDYAAEEKLSAMAIKADLVVAATDPQIDKFKPDPAGLNYILKYFNCHPEYALMVGDRDELDGKSARAVGMKYFQVV